MRVAPEPSALMVQIEAPSENAIFPFWPGNAASAAPGSASAPSTTSPANARLESPSGPPRFDRKPSLPRAGAAEKAYACV